MKFAVNPNFTAPACATQAQCQKQRAAASLAEILAAHTESQRIGFDYLAQRLGLTEAQLDAQCAAAGIQVQVVSP